MKSITIKITDSQGLHARPAAILAGEASKYPFEIKIKKGKQISNLKSLMNIIGLGVKQNDEVEIIAFSENSKEAEKALSAIEKIMKEKGLIK